MVNIRVAEKFRNFFGEGGHFYSARDGIQVFLHTKQHQEHSACFLVVVSFEFCKSRLHLNYLPQS